MQSQYPGNDVWSEQQLDSPPNLYNSTSREHHENSLQHLYNTVTRAPTMLSCQSTKHTPSGFTQSEYDNIKQTSRSKTLAVSLNSSRRLSPSSSRLGYDTAVREPPTGFSCSTHTRLSNSRQPGYGSVAREPGPPPFQIVDDSATGFQCYEGDEPTSPLTCASVYSSDIPDTPRTYGPVARAPDPTYGMTQPQSTTRQGKYEQITSVPEHHTSKHVPVCMTKAGKHERRRPHKQGKDTFEMVPETRHGCKEPAKENGRRPSRKPTRMEKFAEHVVRNF
jgi:hypothetical protein